ncbi:enoyl-CoA hydratase-related protein [Rhodospirillaceae bacterium SYSU D60014]|uniref:enoyl-CoA hydratase/isomerase family protein n=1 Tax=Virgifigura deserti TaxID=2268457 RepID=UPI000E664856
MSDVVLLAREGDIATVTLNRPEKLNALNLAMWRRLGDVMREVAADDGVRCVVLRGAGGQAFSPGADISEFESLRATPAQAEAYAEVMYPALRAVRDCPQPTVAMIQGLCVGAGLEIASLCDLRICGRSSRFGVPIQRLGLTMGYPEIAALIELVGRATALEILLEGRVFDAAEAYDKRLVSRVVPDKAVAEEAMAAARRIADGAPLVHRWHKKFARRCLDPAPFSAAEIAESFAACATEDYRTGIRAFLAKEKPRFEGR